MFELLTSSSYALPAALFGLETNLIYLLLLSTNMHTHPSTLMAVFQQLVIIIRRLPRTKQIGGMAASWPRTSCASARITQAWQTQFNGSGENSQTRANRDCPELSTGSWNVAMAALPRTGRYVGAISSIPARSPPVRLRFAGRLNPRNPELPPRVNDYGYGPEDYALGTTVRENVKR